MAEPTADESERTLSYGERAVGLSFNPSGEKDVTDVKQAMAGVIDTVHGLTKPAGMTEWEEELWTDLQNEAVRLAVSAQMMAVKVLTFKP